MEILDLKILATVADEGTTTRAAHALGLTQPGISQHLSRLEGEVGGRLFDRKGRHLVINDFGRFFLNKAREILNNVDTLKTIKYGAICPVGTFRLCITYAASLKITPSALLKFHHRYPGIHIVLDIEPSERIEESVLNGDHDLGVITTPLMLHPQLEAYTLYSDSIDALVPLTISPASKGTISLEELADFTLILSPKRRRTRQIIDEIFRTHNIYLKDVIDVYSQLAAIQLAEAELGIALLPRDFIIKWITKSRCRHLKISGTPIVRTLSLIRRKDSELTEPASYFYRLITNARTK